MSLSQATLRYMSLVHGFVVHTLRYMSLVHGTYFEVCESGAWVGVHTLRYMSLVPGVNPSEGGRCSGTYLEVYESGARYSPF